MSLSFFKFLKVWSFLSGAVFNKIARALTDAGQLAEYAIKAKCRVSLWHDPADGLWRASLLGECHTHSRDAHRTPQAITASGFDPLNAIERLKSMVNGLAQEKSIFPRDVCAECGKKPVASSVAKA